MGQPLIKNMFRTVCACKAGSAKCISSILILFSKPDRRPRVLHPKNEYRIVKLLTCSRLPSFRGWYWAMPVYIWTHLLLIRQNTDKIGKHYCMPCGSVPLHSVLDFCESKPPLPLLNIACAELLRTYSPINLWKLGMCMQDLPGRMYPMISCGTVGLLQWSTQSISGNDCDPQFVVRLQPQTWASSGPPGGSECLQVGTIPCRHVTCNIWLSLRVNINHG